MITTEISPHSVELWTARAKEHAEHVTPMSEAFLKRRKVGLSHPVHDFLFTYYPFSPQKLKQWVPSIHETLIVPQEIRKEFPWLNEYWFQYEGEILSLNKERIHPGIVKLASFIGSLCDNILERPPKFGCFGLHEWAMVYKQSDDEIRHSGYKLRVPTGELATFVESQRICCTHYDAYRFFTKEAQPFNIFKPVVETRLELEQGGCIHANMDIYKWATRLWPWIGSDFILKAFFLALEGRELDMRASPYDLRHLGYEPICIETEEGRKQYQKEQQLYAERSVALRKELSALCSHFLLGH